LANAAYSAMKRNNEDSCIVISGKFSDNWWKKWSEFLNWEITTPQQYLKGFMIIYTH
jgi:hypothetical protein